MQLDLPNTTTRPQPRTPSQSSQSSHQYGLQRCHASRSPRGSQPERHRDMSSSSRSVSDASDTTSPSAFGEGVHADYLEEQLLRLNLRHSSSSERPPLAGHRIAEYENALTPSIPRQALGFKVIKRADNEPARVNIDDFPNEILTHILSHLHPDSHASVALVSKRFYSLITSPHAWRMAFQRFFPAQDALIIPNQPQGVAWGEDDDDMVRSNVRAFVRLTPHASWRTEYLLRTRLLRSLARGKPGANSGGIGMSARSGQSGKKATAVLTYNTKLPSVVTHLHATFTNGKKPPRVIHGATDLGIASTSDPSVGKVEKWGLDDPLAFAQLDEVMPQLIPYGMGEGPAAMPNVMDVSQPYGLVGGEGLPGGRVFFSASGEYRGKYLGPDSSLIEAYPDIPKIPELSEGICSVWIAKSSSVPTVTKSMVGIMTGSSLGVVTTYALGYDPSGPRYTPGEISARWVLSPGVPIISLKVDDSYSQKRKALNRVCAVALNALGEIYYLTLPPTPPPSKTKADDSTKLAWHTGRTTYWHLVEATRREARPDESGRNAIRGSYSPRSPSNAMGLTRDQTIAEAREIEKFLRYKPAHFRKVCYGWDMRRKLEVDFASDDELGAGESVFIVGCAVNEDESWSLTRFTRSIASQAPINPQGTEYLSDTAPKRSIFGDSGVGTTSPNSPSSLPVQASSSGQRPPFSISASKTLDDWFKTIFSSKEISNSTVNASAIDMSLMALTTSSEDPLKAISIPSSSSPATPSGQSPSDIPGRRARLIGLGTNTGKVVLWNMRAGHTGDGIFPVRVIETESPEVTCLALSALYLVHGGSDGLVQAWDPLASTMDPIRTLNSRSPGRMPRHHALNATLGDANYTAIGAIYLDPDPTVLHGIVAFGTFVRYWAYSSSNHGTGRKRKLRHSDVNGRLIGRRHGGGVKGYIAAEAEELRDEQRHKAREQARLRSRFGVGMNNLSEEEALQYAEMISQESFLLDEQRRISVSDTGSAADLDTTSTSESMNTITPDPSVADTTPPTGNTSTVVEAMSESEYELQIQTAIRLSLLEGVNDLGRSPKGYDSGELDVPIIFKEKKTKRSSSSSPSSSRTSMVKQAGSSSRVMAMPTVADDDLELALQLSLAEEESRKEMAVLETSEEEFPPLGGDGWGKGKGKAI
ncbi:hypothetical protein F5B22DRAFT_587624 [Xylaria bambusicola]|uniref:uncharacterized protein n=1 Tax=Xylaria bambusicola TaxID=326684 RepID=UPI0020073CAF|nr:uncharacterized protein F5B22DRAFT_587624 [Xylaria bambusicola]KAI0525761.1 hypothetical protein F5B22DRAFT_587624 [Xylaria bambusicola]